MTRPPAGRMAGPVPLLLSSLIVGCLVLLAPGSVARAADVEEARRLFHRGEYARLITAAEDAIAAGAREEPDWWMLKIRAELATGAYRAALRTYESAVSLQPESLPVRVLGYDVYRASGRPQDADQILATIRVLAGRRPWQYGDVQSQTALGRALLLSGADARQVLELFFDGAKEADPDAPEPWLASGELALLKQDYALAAESYREAVRRAPENPDAHFGLAKSYQGDSEHAEPSLVRALEINPRHVPSLLYQADNAIDAEQYEAAEAFLELVLDVNPKNSDAWAYRAALAHLRGDADAEAAHRAKALEPWPQNPAVDHLIGLKLSQHYRFAEGKAYQQRALEMDAEYVPARIQLAQDLLRLGDEDGWRYAAEVFARDRYNVVAYNLITLRDGLRDFRTIANDRFVVRMDAREADIYGQRVMDLLDRAHSTLTAKYGVTLDGQTVVEIFPQQKDFAIRTFGLPGGAGYLGVCFGDVVTVNSPASRAGSPSNWQAVLWHEFAHVVTLNKTRNKMPRWLSEGISVYEERQQNPGWGQVMTPRYRQMILDGEATKVSQLSGAFLNPPTPGHIPFAYYQSSMVVEHIVERFGLPAIQRVLDDLGNDVPINEALARHTEPIDELDENFDAWFRAQAEALAPHADWTREGLPLDGDSATLAAWNREHPDNVLGLLNEGRALIAERRWAEAKRPLERAIELYPDYREPGGPYELLAAAHRGLGETDAERAMLEKHVALSADAVEPRLRLMEIASAAEDWDDVLRVGEGVLAVNPLVPTPYRHMARAAEALEQRPAAISAHRTLLLMDPLDPAEHQYRLARLLVEEGQWVDARREVVRALEEAPRYADAHALLLQIVEQVEPDRIPTTRPAPPRVVPAPATVPTTQRGE